MANKDIFEEFFENENERKSDALRNALAQLDDSDVDALVMLAGVPREDLEKLNK